VTDDETRPHSAQLTELGEQITLARQRARELELAQQRITDEAAALAEEIIECHATGDDVRATKLGKTRARLEGVAIREAGERLEGAKRAIDRAEVERSAFCMEHADELLAERRPDAEAAAAAVRDAVEALAAAQKMWDSAQSDLAAISRLAGPSTESLPRFPEALADLTRHARRAGQVDVPTPAGN
jgi:formate dehydrogenase maturation protein FdhE